MINQGSYQSCQLRVKSFRYRLDECRYTIVRLHRFMAAGEIRFMKYAAHALVWAFLYFFPSLLSLPANGDWQVVFSEQLTIISIGSFAGLVAFFYLNYHVLLPRLYLAGSYTAYFSILSFALAALICAGCLSGRAHAVLPGLNYATGLFIISTLVSIILCQQSGLSITTAEMEKTKASFLNTQINPHFLFNSLNWIYYLALEQSQQTPAAIVQLSGFMRYLMKDANAASVALGKEIEYIKNYISLQRGKLGDTVLVTYSIPEYNGDLKIAPLLLMSFIENAFKHGINPDEDSAIRIDISLTGSRLSAQVINNKVTSTIKAAGLGMGIENARQRLQLLYPFQHHLDIHHDNKIYAVRLSINLPS